MASVINGPLYYEGSFLMGNNLPLTDRYQIMTKAANALYCDGNVMIASNGSVAINFDAVGGNLAIGKTSAAYKIDVEGDINFTGNLFQNGSLFSSGNGGSSKWTTSGNHIHYNTGNVGIGTSLPDEKLHIAGNAIVSGTLSTSSIVGSLLTASQPNITTVGTLTSLSVSGVISAGSTLNLAGNLIGNNHISVVGNITANSLSVSSINTTTISGSLTSISQPNITTVGTLTNLSVSGILSVGSTFRLGGNMFGNNHLSIAGNATINNIFTSGNVGIGTTTASYPLDVISNVLQTFPNGIYYMTGVTGTNPTAVWNGSYTASTRYGIRSLSYIYSALGFVTASDNRIKKDIQMIDDDDALTKLRQIEPKRYRYIDPARGLDEVYGFIAQEVNAIFPDATQITSQEVPNVFGAFQVELPNKIFYSTAEDISEIVLITYGNEKITCKILEKTEHSILVDRTFTALDLDSESRIFIYGKVVNDFLTLKKDYLWTINFAATQELDRQVQTLKQENADLKQQLQTILSKLEAAGF